MIKKEIDFILPIGYLDEKNVLHKEGKMREATALDEIEINNDEKIRFNERYHDIILLSRVVTKLGELASIDTGIIENMFEVDFRYLQTLYKELNGESENGMRAECPSCGALNKINLSKVYENLDIYFKKEE